MVKTRPFLSFLHVMHGVFGPQTGPFPSIVSLANKVLTESYRNTLPGSFYRGNFLNALQMTRNRGSVAISTNR
jgi:hypothetical protein